MRWGLAVLDPVSLFIRRSRADLDLFKTRWKLVDRIYFSKIGSAMRQGVNRTSPRHARPRSPDRGRPFFCRPLEFAVFAADDPLPALLEVPLLVRFRNEGRRVTKERSEPQVLIFSAAAHSHARQIARCLARR
jgi:hypothetical protein